MLNVINYVNKKKPDLVVCTGDLTHKGWQKQYIGIKEYIDKINVPVLSVPGNHDAKNNGLDFFRKYISSTGPGNTKLIINDYLILGLCSPKDGVKYGELGEGQLNEIIEEFEDEINPPKRILALHHHLIDVPEAGVKRGTLLDAGNVLQMARKYDVKVVLMGHRHVPHVWKFHDVFLVYCGTTCSERLRGDDSPCFNEIILDDDKVKVYVVDSKNLEKKLLLNHKGGITKYIKDRESVLEDDD